MPSDPMRWSLPLGRLFGINVRVHILFPVVALGIILRVAVDDPKPPDGAWIDMAMIVGLLFFSVLLHEFGHCFAGRWMDGEANDVLLWPLGGLAYVEVPHTPRAHFVTAAGGPLVNLGLCLGSAVVLIFALGYWPPLLPWTSSTTHFPFRFDGTGSVYLYAWGGGEMTSVTPQGLGLAAILVARLFWVNWLLLLINVVLIGFPLDGGRMVQAALWRYLGYRQATLAAIFAGFFVMFVVGLAAIVFKELLALCLAVVIYFACRQEWIALESGSEEGPFGYDFSQGYTSLERDHVTAAPQSRRKQNWWQRWRQKQNAKKLQRQQEQREAEERRMDELLAKVQREGMGALTEEEKRFLKRVSDRYRNRQ
jgi:stage IV sporulation protein FB